MRQMPSNATHLCITPHDCTFKPINTDSNNPFYKHKSSAASILQVNSIMFIDFSSKSLYQTFTQTRSFMQHTRLDTKCVDLCFVGVPYAFIGRGVRG